MNYSEFTEHGFKAKVVEVSRAHHGVKLFTLQLRYPFFIHPEFLTHRAFSRNSASARAIPVAKMIEQVRNDPAMPIFWGSNKPGMQAGEGLEGVAQTWARDNWLLAARSAAASAESMADIGLHKQIANRVLQPYQWMHTVVSATEWDNFFALRDHPDAQPEIQLLARLMKQAIDAAEPVYRSASNATRAIGWHLPYISDVERLSHDHEPQYLAKLSAARCARVSYLKHDGGVPKPGEDLGLFERLVGSAPIHASPTEHQAFPTVFDTPCRNFNGWCQFRVEIEGGAA